MFSSLRSIRNPRILKEYSKIRSLPLTLKRTFTFLLPTPQLRAFTAESSPTTQPQIQHPSQEEISIKTFGRLSLWSTCLESSHQISVWIRNQEERHVEISSILLQHAIVGEERARLRVQWPEPFTWSVPVLNLRSHETPASLMFLFWLYNRRLPELFRDCELGQSAPPAQTAYSTRDERDVIPRSRQGTWSNAAFSDRDKKEVYNINLIHAWMLGANLRAPQFQNDVMRKLGKLLQREDLDSRRSSDPNYSSAIKWARKAFEAASFDPPGDTGSAPPPHLTAAPDTIPLHETPGGNPEAHADPIALESCPPPPYASVVSVPTAQNCAPCTQRTCPPGSDIAVDIGKNLRDLAVDVAAKRVCDEGYDGLILTPHERQDLSGNQAFAKEVFAMLGGHMGTGGVEIEEMARAYLVEELMG